VLPLNTDNTICGHPTVNGSTRPVIKDYELSTAIGKNNYNIGAKHTNENINEDVYPNVYKHWDINYSCL
jgi:hypothetical protein